LFELDFSLFLSTIIKAEKPTIKTIAITDLVVNGDANRNIDAIAVKTT